MAYPYNGILFSSEKEWNADTCYNMDESQNILLSSQAQKAMYRMIPSMQVVQRGPIPRDRKLVSGLEGWEEEDGKELPTDREFLLGMIQMF